MAKVWLKGDFLFYGPNLFWASFWTWNSLSWSLNGCMVLACYCTTRLPHSRGASSPEDQQPITKELTFIGGKAFYKMRVSVYFHSVETTDHDKHMWLTEWRDDEWLGSVVARQENHSNKHAEVRQAQLIWWCINGERYWRAVVLSFSLQSW